MSSHQPGLFLCIDCGGSKTACAIANAAGKIIARATDGPSNFADVGVDGFVRAVKGATQKALSSIYPASNLILPTSAPHFKAVWIGASGIDREEDAAPLLQPLSRLLSIPTGPGLSIGNDTSLLASPLQEFPAANTAVVAIAGTGSCVAAFREDQNDGDRKLKEIGREGGLGWILGDEGSGIHVGKETIRWVLNRNNRSCGTGDITKEGQDDDFQAAVLEHYGLQTATEIIYLVYAEDPSKDPAPSVAAKDQTSKHWLSLSRKARIASVTPIVFDHAFKHHSPAALAILTIASHGSATQILQVIRTAGIADCKQTVLCFGGSLVGVEAYRKLIVEDLREAGLVFAGVAFVKDAAVSGAERLASNGAGSPS
ncbi:hypothetical protein FRB97_006852 [Tulasnella sp. 331]|nr:hypothetical protein FRB97_006852 [Tulasnella sp. 331]